MTHRRPYTVAPRALLAAVACLALIFLLPAGATESETTTFTVAVSFVETTPDALAHAEATLGFSLDPTQGRCILSGDEHAALLRAVTGKDRGRVVGNGSVSFLPGGSDKLNAVETVRVPQRYEARTDPADPSSAPRIVPIEFTERDVGLRIEVKDTGNPSPDLLRMGVILEASRIVDWHSFAPGTTEPLIKTWSLTATLVVPVEKTLILVNRPHEPFDSSALSPAAKPTPPTVTLLLIQAKGAALSAK